MHAAQSSLLVIEDSDEDFAAFERIARQLAVPNPIYRCVDGEEALAFLRRTGKYADPLIAPRPSIVLLDLNLPGTDGREVLAEIDRDIDLKMIPVVVFTTSSNPKDIDSCYQQGANAYLVKPMDALQLKHTIQVFFDYWFRVCLLPVGG